MFVAKATAGISKKEAYAELCEQARAMLSDQRDGLANAANLSALLNQVLPDLNWVGFYFMREGALLVGAFQGKVACVNIALGHGVCGTAAAQRRTVIVPDVEKFPGHIACDHASRSEIVVPLIQRDALVGVLDLDSPSLARFDADDAAGLEAIAKIFVEGSDLDRVADPAVDAATRSARA